MLPASPRGVRTAPDVAHRQGRQGALGYTSPRITDGTQPLDRLVQEATTSHLVTLYLMPVAVRGRPEQRAPPNPSPRPKGTRKTRTQTRSRSDRGPPKGKGKSKQKSPAAPRAGGKPSMPRDGGARGAESVAASTSTRGVPCPPAVTPPNAKGASPVHGMRQPGTWRHHMPERRQELVTRDSPHGT